ARARVVLEQHVAVTDQRRQDETDHVILAHDRLVDIGDQLVEGIREPRRLLLGYWHSLSSLTGSRRPSAHRLKSTTLLLTPSTSTHVLGQPQWNPPSKVLPVKLAVMLDLELLHQYSTRWLLLVKCFSVMWSCQQFMDPLS